jgi:4-amino-4-deoxy-L-arabinose transferase-like glycosyltransferase
MSIFLLGFFLRVFRLPDFISYHQDQVRDLYYIQDHFQQGKIILLGPKASVGNFFLPPFWYYLMSFIYFFSHSPIAPAFLVVVLNSLTVIIIYLFCQKFLDKKTAIFSSLLYAVSPFSIEYSRFAWNPNPIPFFTALSSYFLFNYFYKKKVMSFYLSLIAASLTFQLHYQGFLLVVVIFLVSLLKKDYKTFFLGSAIFIVFLTPFFISELQNNFQNTKGIVYFLEKTTQGKSFGIKNSVKVFTKEAPEFFSRSIFFNFKILGIIFSLVFYILIGYFIFNFLRKKIDLKNKQNFLTFLLTILFLTLFIYRQWIVPYYLLITMVPLIIYFVLILKKYPLVLISIVILNLYFSPSFKNPGFSMPFFENTISILKNNNIPSNCIDYKINNKDLKFAPLGILYLLDIKNINIVPQKNCYQKLYICEIGLCDKIKKRIVERNNTLGLETRY